MTPASRPSRFRRFAARLHRDERGVTSVLSLVAVFAFTMLLVMLTNVVRHVDDKVRMQNAADAATFSGTVVLARGMNSIALANHLQAETLALTALTRALDERGSLPARRLRRMMEFILGSPEHLDPLATNRLLVNYQRDVLRLMPRMSQDTTNEISLRHGLRRGQVADGRGPVRFDPHTGSGSRGPLWGVLWRSSAVSVGSEDQDDPELRSLPIIDPNLDGADFGSLTNIGDWQSVAIARRLEISSQYLRNWIADVSQATGRVDGSLTNDAVEQLLLLLEVEYPNTNLPLMVRSSLMNEGEQRNRALQQDYSFMGVVYRAPDREHGPKLFKNPISANSDSMAFAQAALFLPQPRYRCCPWVIETDRGTQTNRDPWTGDWDSFNQTWSAKLVPCDAATAFNVLQAQPPAPADSLRPLKLDNVQPMDLERINAH
jgi:hypothetical protein